MASTKSRKRSRKWHTAAARCCSHRKRDSSVSRSHSVELRDSTASRSRWPRREAFTGETTGRVLSCETGLIPRCRSSSLTRRQHLPWRSGLHGKNLAQSKTLRTWRSSLCGTWEVSSVPGLVPGRLGKAIAVRRAMYADEKSDEAVVLRKRPNKGRQLPAEVVEGKASPEGNSRQAAVVRTLIRVATSIRIAAARWGAWRLQSTGPRLF